MELMKNITQYVIPIMSFIIICYGLRAQLYSMAQERLKNRCFVLERILASDWYNEGDPFCTDGKLYRIEFYDFSTLSHIGGALHAQNINREEDKKLYEFSGFINKKGKVKIKLRLPIGKWGANIGEATISYDQELDQLEYKFHHYIDNIDMYNENQIIDTKRDLWRAP